MNGTKKFVFGLCVAFVLAGCSSNPPVEDETPTEAPTEEVQEESMEESMEENGHDAHGEGHAGMEHEAGVVGTVASAEMMNGEGESVGTVTFTQTEEGVLVEGSITGLTPGVRGFHVHENGVCDAPDFLGAGGHFNPTGTPHGAPDNEMSHRHAGDFGNIEVGEDGATFSFMDSMITLRAGTNDIVGHALIIHEDQDDLESQPTGNAGSRAACGIVEVTMAE